MSYPTKTEQEKLWAALCALTYKPGVQAPYDCVLVSDRDLFATNGYVACLVHGMYQPGIVMPRIHAAEIVSDHILQAERVRTIVHDSIEDIFAHGAPTGVQEFDVRYLQQAIRPHNAFKNARVRIKFPLNDSDKPAILQSSVGTHHEPIEVTTIIQPISRRR